MTQQRRRWRQRRGGGMTARNINVKIMIPFVAEISGTWEPDESERQAAWELYVELATRVTVIELGDDEGLLREALSSLYTVFGSTRDILRRYGPSVAPQVPPGHVTFGVLAVNILNLSLRPLLSKWHPLLTSYEATRPPHIDPVTHERDWARAAELRTEIERVRMVLTSLADSLKKVAGVGDLITPHVPRQAPTTEE